MPRVICAIPANIANQTNAHRLNAQCLASNLLEAPLRFCAAHKYADVICVGLISYVLCPSFTLYSFARCLLILIKIGQGVMVWKIILFYFFPENQCQKKETPAGVWFSGKDSPSSARFWDPAASSSLTQGDAVGIKVTGRGWKVLWWEGCWTASILQMWWLEE